LSSLLWISKIFSLKKKQNYTTTYPMSTEEKVATDTNNPSSSAVFSPDITKQLEDIHLVLKQTYNAFLHFQETDREFISEEDLLLEEGLAKERKEQELEHEAMRIAFRQKTKKDQQQNQERILRKARSLVDEQNKNSQVWDSSSQT